MIETIVALLLPFSPVGIVLIGLFAIWVLYKTKGPKK